MSPAKLIPAFSLTPLEDALTGERLGMSWERGRAFSTVSSPLFATGNPCYLAGQDPVPKSTGKILFAPASYPSSAL